MDCFVSKLLLLLAQRYDVMKITRIKDLTLNYNTIVMLEVYRPVPELNVMQVSSSLFRMEHKI